MDWDNNRMMEYLRNFKSQTQRMLHLPHRSSLASIVEKQLRGFFGCNDLPRHQSLNDRSTSTGVDPTVAMKRCQSIYLAWLGASIYAIGWTHQLAQFWGKTL